MKTNLLVVASALAVSVMSLEAANIAPGTVAAVSVTGVDGVQDSAGEYVGPYQGTVNGMNFAIFCDDLDRNINIGDVVNMNVSAIGDLSLTRFGGSAAATKLTAVASYEKIFYLSSYLAVASANDRKDIQDAMWSYFTTGNSDPTSAAITGWETKANANYQGKDYSGFRILTDAGKQYNGKQELFVSTTPTTPGLTGTPEPGTWAMLVSGIGALTLARARRKKA